MATLTDALEELSADESGVVFCPRLEPFIEFDDVGMVEALEDLHFSPHALLVPLDLLLRNGLQRDIARDVRRLGGVNMRGCMGSGRGDREDGCGGKGVEFFYLHFPGVDMSRTHHGLSERAFFLFAEGGCDIAFWETSENISLTLRNPNQRFMLVGLWSSGGRR